MTNTDQIAHRLAEFLKPFLSDYKYTKSKYQFRSKKAEFIKDIIINVTRGSSGTYTIALNYGVAHQELEAITARIEERKVDSYNRTISQNSPNAKKQIILPYRETTWWYPLEENITFESKTGESIKQFVVEFIFTYFKKFSNLEAIRNSTVERDGLSMNFFPYKTVLVINAILNDQVHIDNYLKKLQEEVNSGYHHNILDFNLFYSKLKSWKPEVFKTFELTKKEKG